MPRDLFDAGRAGVELLLKAARTPEGASPQDRIIRSAGGRGRPAGSEFHEQAVGEYAVLLRRADGLVPLTVLFEVADHAESLSRGGETESGADRPSHREACGDRVRREPR